MLTSRKQTVVDSGFSKGKGGLELLRPTRLVESRTELLTEGYGKRKSDGGVLHRSRTVSLISLIVLPPILHTFLKSSLSKGDSGLPVCSSSIQHCKHWRCQLWGTGTLVPDFPKFIFSVHFGLSCCTKCDSDFVRMPVLFVLCDSSSVAALIEPCSLYIVSCHFIRDK